MGIRLLTGSQQGRKEHNEYIPFFPAKNEQVELANADSCSIQLQKSPSPNTVQKQLKPEHCNSKTLNVINPKP